MNRDIVLLLSIFGRGYVYSVGKWICAKNKTAYLAIIGQLPLPFSKLTKHIIILNFGLLSLFLCKGEQSENCLMRETRYETNFITYKINTDEIHNNIHATNSGCVAFLLCKQQKI